MELLNTQGAGLGAEIGTGECKWSPKHLGQVLHEGMVGNPDANKRSKGVQVFVELLGALHHQGHWSWQQVLQELLGYAHLAVPVDVGHAAQAHGQRLGLAAALEAIHAGQGRRAARRAGQTIQRVGRDRHHGAGAQLGHGGPQRLGPTGALGACGLHGPAPREPQQPGPRDCRSGRGRA